MPENVTARPLLMKLAELAEKALQEKCHQEGQSHYVIDLLEECFDDTLDLFEAKRGSDFKEVARKQIGEMVAMLALLAKADGILED